jgi:ABC-type branched-subunit amino acid transport system substrate-binding protein
MRAGRRQHARRRAAAAGLALATLLLAACGQKPGVHSLAAGSAAGGGLSNGETDQGLAQEGQSVTGSPAGGAGGGGAGGRTASAAAGANGRAQSGGGAATAAGGGAGGGNDTTGVTADTITVGVHGPVTGAAPFPATSFNSGKDVYFNFINGQSGIAGRKVKVVFQDDGYNPSQAVSVCKKMVQQDHVFMLIGLGGTDQIVACSQYAASVGVPYASEGVSEQGLNGLQNYFGLSMTYKAQGLLLAQYMKHVLHVTRVGMIRANTANFDDAHTGFLQAAQQLGLQVTFDRAIDKNADSQTAFSAGGSICGNRANAPEAVYPLMGPSIWVQVLAGANAQACNPIWSGVGISMGLNTVGTAACGVAPTTKAHFFSPFTALNVANQTDPDYNRAYQQQHGQAGDDIGWGIWGLEKLVSAMLAAPGRNLSRQSFVTASTGKSFATGAWPTVNFAASHFGGTAVHLLQLDCTKQQYVEEQTNKSSF